MKTSQMVFDLQSGHDFVTDGQGKNNMSPNPTGGDINIKRWISFFCGSSKYERNGSRAQLTWRPTLHVNRYVHVSMNLRKMKFIS